MSKQSKSKATKSLVNQDILLGLKIRTDLRAGTPMTAPSGPRPPALPPPARMDK